MMLYLTSRCFDPRFSDMTNFRKPKMCMIVRLLTQSATIQLDPHGNMMSIP